MEKRILVCPCAKFIHWTKLPVDTSLDQEYYPRGFWTSCVKWKREIALAVLTVTVLTEGVPYVALPPLFHTPFRLHDLFSVAVFPSDRWATTIVGGKRATASQSSNVTRRSDASVLRLVYARALPEPEAVEHGNLQEVRNAKLSETSNGA